MSESEALEAARKAWAAKADAEAQIARLNRYTRLNHQMRQDRLEHTGRLRVAEQTLQSVLGGAKWN